MSKKLHKNDVSKNVSAFEWGRRAGVLNTTLHFSEAIAKHHRPLLPRQRRAFERGFRQGTLQIEMDRRRAKESP